MGEGAVLEMRLVITTEAFEEVLQFYRDQLGLRQEALIESPEGSVALLAAGRATLEISDERNAAYIDRLEVGRRVAGPIRVAFQVADTAATAERLSAAGATILGAARPTPFGSINARLAAPASLQLTLFQQVGEEAWAAQQPDDGEEKR